MRHLSKDETRAFLLEGTRTAKLATIKEDGRPHVCPIWFVLDGDSLVFNTGAQTVKGKNLARTGRAAASVDSETPPFAFVLVEGRVEISEDLHDLVRWATKIGGRYMGEERAEEFGRRNGVPGEYLFV